MASAELLKMVRAVDDRVQDVGRDVRGDVQDIGNKVQDVDDKVQGIASEVRGVDDKLDEANRSLSF
jgi:peptidoglycan hydrolase CwlO-like protein